MQAVQKMADLAASGKKRAARMMSRQVSDAPARTLVHRFGDHIQGVVYAGVVMILGAVMIVEAGNVVNYTTVDNIVTNLTDTLSTGSNLIILLILAIIFGFALFYLQMSGGPGQSGGKKKSRT